jgi:hypothetical protein
MEIGIIGAGFIGGTLTRLLAERGHAVRVSNSRDPETLAELATETGARAVWAAEAPVDADLVIVSIPQKNVPDLAPGIVATAKPGAPIIETNNYYPQQRDGLIEEIEAGKPESVWVSEHLGAPSSRSSTGSTGSTCSSAAPPRAAPAGSPYRSPATTRRTSRSSSTWSTRSASIRSTAARSPNPGASSPTLPSTARTSTPRPPCARSPRHRRSVRRPSAPPPDASGPRAG